MNTPLPDEEKNRSWESEFVAWLLNDQAIFRAWLKALYG